MANWSWTTANVLRKFVGWSGKKSKLQGKNTKLQGAVYAFEAINVHKQHTHKHDMKWNNHHIAISSFFWSSRISLSSYVYPKRQAVIPKRQSMGLRSSPPLHFNLDPSVLRIYEMVLLVDPFVVNNIWQTDIHIAQTFLFRER